MPFTTDSDTAPATRITTPNALKSIMKMAERYGVKFCGKTNLGTTPMSWFIKVIDTYMDRFQAATATLGHTSEYTEPDLISTFLGGETARWFCTYVYTTYDMFKSDLRKRWGRSVKAAWTDLHTMSYTGGDPHHFIEHLRNTADEACVGDDHPNSAVQLEEALIRAVNNREMQRDLQKMHHKSFDDLTEAFIHLAGIYYPTDPSRYDTPPPPSNYGYGQPDRRERSERSVSFAPPPRSYDGPPPFLRDRLDKERWPPSSRPNGNMGPNQGPGPGRHNGHGDRNGQPSGGGYHHPANSSQPPASNPAPQANPSPDVQALANQLEKLRIDIVRATNGSTPPRAGMMSAAPCVGMVADQSSRERLRSGLLAKAYNIVSAASLSDPAAVPANFFDTMYGFMDTINSLGAYTSDPTPTPTDFTPPPSTNLVRVNDEQQPANNDTVPCVMANTDARPANMRSGYANRSPMQLDAPTAPTNGPAQRAPPAGAKRAVLPDDPPPIRPSELPSSLAKKVLSKLKVSMTVEQAMLLSGPFRAALASEFNTVDQSARQPHNAAAPTAAMLETQLDPSDNHPFTYAPSPPPHASVPRPSGGEQRPSVLHNAAPTSMSLVSVDATVNGAAVNNAFIDCGAQVNVMASPTAGRLGLLKTCGPGVPFRGIGSPTVTSLGTCTAIVSVGNVALEQEFIIVNDTSHSYGLLLGLPWLHATNATIDFKSMEIHVQSAPHTRHIVPLKTSSGAETSHMFMTSTPPWQPDIEPGWDLLPSLLPDSSTGSPSTPSSLSSHSSSLPPVPPYLKVPPVLRATDAAIQQCLIPPKGEAPKCYTRPWSPYWPLHPAHLTGDNRPGLRSYLNALRATPTAVGSAKPIPIPTSRPLSPEAASNAVRPNLSCVNPPSPPVIRVANNSSRTSYTSYTTTPFSNPTPTKPTNGPYPQLLEVNAVIGPSGSPRNLVFAPACLDTGSTINALHVLDAIQCGLLDVEATLRPPTHKTFIGVDGEKAGSYGTFPMLIQVGSFITELDFEVLSGCESVVLGLPWLMAANATIDFRNMMVSIHFPPPDTLIQAVPLYPRPFCPDTTTPSVMMLRCFDTTNPSYQSALEEQRSRGINVRRVAISRNLEMWQDPITPCYEPTPEAYNVYFYCINTLHEWDVRARPALNSGRPAPTGTTPADLERHRSTLSNSVGELRTMMRNMYETSNDTLRATHFSNLMSIAFTAALGLNDRLAAIAPLDPSRPYVDLTGNPPPPRQEPHSSSDSDSGSDTGSDNGSDSPRPRRRTHHTDSSSDDDETADSDSDADYTLTYEDLTFLCHDLASHARVLAALSTEPSPPFNDDEPPPLFDPSPPEAKRYPQITGATDTEYHIEVPGYPIHMRIGRSMPLHLLPDLINVPAEYKDVFAFSMDDMRLPALLPPHRIKLKPGTQPIVVKRYRRPPAQDELIAKLAREQLRHGIIEPANSPWCFQPLVVEKRIDPGVDKATLPIEDRYRPVHDFRLLNNACLADTHAMPVVSEVVERAAAATWRSKADIKGAFFQLSLEPESRPLTAFQTIDGIFQFTRMPQGLMGSPATFMRAMEIAFGDLDFMHKYFDDLCPGAYGPPELHLSHIERMLGRMRKYNLKANPSKTIFFLTSVTFTGHVLEDGTYRPDPHKTSSVDSLDPSRSVTSLQQFLGFCNYYGRHIPNIASITKPLRDRLKKGADSEWMPIHQAATDALKHAVKNTVMLHSPDWTQPFLLAIDYSKDALAAVLSQRLPKPNGTGYDERPICFASRSTTTHESKLSATEGELAALVYGIKYFHPYLWGRSFVIETDHQALTYLHCNKDKVSKLSRMAVLLQDYSFTVTYKRGKLNTNADTLSRNPPVHDCIEDGDFPDPFDFPCPTSSSHESPTRSPPQTTHQPPRIGMILPTPSTTSGIHHSTPPVNALDSFYEHYSFERDPTEPFILNDHPPSGNPSPVVGMIHLHTSSTAELQQQLQELDALLRPPPEPQPPTDDTPLTGFNNELWLDFVRRVNLLEAADKATSQQLPPDTPFVGMFQFNPSSVAPNPDGASEPPPPISRDPRKRPAEHQLAVPPTSTANDNVNAPSLPTTAIMTTPALLPSTTPIPVTSDEPGTSSGPTPLPPGFLPYRHQPDKTPTPAIKTKTTKRPRKLSAKALALAAALVATDNDVPTTQPTPSNTHNMVPLSPFLLASAPTPSPLPATAFQRPGEDTPDISKLQPSLPPTDDTAMDDAPTDDELGPTTTAAHKASIVSKSAAAAAFKNAEVDPLATCKICGNPDDEHLLLVCDGCNSLVHTYCNDNALEVIPSGSYFCDRCRPPFYDCTEHQTSGNAYFDPPRDLYKDIWLDSDTLAFLKDPTIPASPRVIARASRYQWIKDKLLTKDGRQVPRPEDRPHLLTTAHTNLGHRGYRSVAELLRYEYYWSGMREDSRAAVQNCAACAHRGFKPVSDPVLHSIPHSDIFNKWTIDLIGPLPPSTPFNNKYIAVGVESYSRNVVAAAHSNKTAASVTHWFRDRILYSYGAPLEVQCDNGGEFMREFRTLCKTYNIKLTHGAAYHPQSQGLVERANQTLENSITAYVAAHGRHSWEHYLPQCVFAMRAAASSTTRFSPFYLMHAVHPRLPLDQPVPAPPAPLLDDMDDVRMGEINASMHARAASLNAAHTDAEQHRSKAQARQATSYARRRSTATAPAAGAIIYVRNTANRNATDPAALGPYRIQSILPNGRCILTNGKDQWEEDIDLLLVRS